MFREELEKILTNGVFYAAIVSAVILLMLGYIYKSPYTGEEHTVLGMMFNDDREALIKEADLHATDVILGGIDSYLEMFVPVIVVIPFAIIVCGERKNSNTRFEIYRLGKTRYIMGKYLADMVSGGLIVMSGYMVFSLMISLLLPGGTGIVAEYQNQYLADNSFVAGALMKGFGYKGLYMLKFLRMFVYGAVSVIPAFGISMITRNRYVIISIPFLFNYLLEKFIIKQESVNLIYVMNKTCGNIYATDIKRMAIVFGAEILLIGVFCRVYLGRKCDCGGE